MLKQLKEIEMNSYKKIFIFLMNELIMDLYVT
jgi:hypothetical protein